jgi:hypothetical protein
MTMMTRLLWSVLVVVPVLLLLISAVPVTAAATVAVATAAEQQEDLACLKLQFWTGGDDCAGDPDNTAINTVPTTPSDDCGTYVRKRFHHSIIIIIFDRNRTVSSSVHTKIHRSSSHQSLLTIPRLANAV